MYCRIYTIHAFARTDEGGNPAGIVYDAGSLTEREMLHIAAAVGFSETVFIKRTAPGIFETRFFTPAGEVDLCGHATVGAFSALFQKKIIGPGRYTQRTKAGDLPVDVYEDASVMMLQNPPRFGQPLTREEIADSLGIQPSLLVESLPVQPVSTGLWDILVPVGSLAALQAIKPDFQKVTDVSRKYGVVGYHLFTTETLFEADAHCRNLAPLYEIPEEAATGTSSGALGCYLYRYGLHDGSRQMVFEQGYSMKRPSEIRVSLAAEGSKITGVTVGGNARNMSENYVEFE